MKKGERDRVMTGAEYVKTNEVIGDERHAACEVHRSCVEPYPEPVNKDEALHMSTTSLAWLGDAVYEMYVRKYIVDTGVCHADRLHTASVRFVKAGAQAGVVKALLAGQAGQADGAAGEAGQADGAAGEDNPAGGAAGTAERASTNVSENIVLHPAARAAGMLDADEQALIRRARNKKNASRPKNADPMDYKWATAFEALIGYYYMTEQTQKLEDVILFALNDIEGT